jgi:hypothetical protein
MLLRRLLRQKLTRQKVGGCDLHFHILSIHLCGPAGIKRADLQAACYVVGQRACVIFSGSLSHQTVVVMKPPFVRVCGLHCSLRNTTGRHHHRHDADVVLEM